jgi:hypothetical protein
VDFEGLLHTITTTIDTYMDIVLMEFIRFWHFTIDVESCKCVYLGGKNKNTSFWPLLF